MKNLFLTKTRWLVTIILLTALGTTNVWGAEQTVTFTYSGTDGITNTSYSTSYALHRWSATSSDGTVIYAGGKTSNANNGGAWGIRYASSRTGEMLGNINPSYDASASWKSRIPSGAVGAIPGKIKSIEVTFLDATAAGRGCYILVGTSQIYTDAIDPTSTPSGCVKSAKKTKASSPYSVSESYDITNTAYTYFGVVSGSSSYCGISSIVVTYDDGAASCTLSSISLNTTSVQKTFCVGDAFNYTGLVTTASYSGGCSNATVTPTSVSSPAMGTAGSKTITVSYTEGGVTKTATYTITVQAKYTVTWMVNGSSYTTGNPDTQVCPGSHVTNLPTAPSPGSYCGDVFAGWTDAAYSGNSAPTHLYKQASDFPNASGNQTFYAVFADYAN